MIKFLQPVFESVKSIEFFQQPAIALLVTNAHSLRIATRDRDNNESTVGQAVQLAASLVFAAGLLPPDRRLSRPVDRLCQTYYSTNVLK